ncbi:MAG TPA: hypothetical protein PLQ56_25090 [Aggregatilineales bacterium]|nr:hypothetical protein [Aggregatilineales bacterium]
MANKRYRIEGNSRSDEVATGQESRIADPLWMLARQWQVGEFRGEDAASPVLIQYSMHTSPVSTFRSYKANGSTQIDSSVPLEMYAEQQVPSSLAAFARAAEAGSHFLRMLSASGFDALRAGIRDQYSLAAPSQIEPEETAWVQMLIRRSCDGERIYRERSHILNGIQNQVNLVTVVNAWVAWYEDRFADDARFDSWDSERMEYRFTVAASDEANSVVLEAKEYQGGHLDWYSFDIQEQKRRVPAKSQNPPTKNVLPTPVRFAGMAASRWWEFEDGSVNFGDVSASAVDFARMITAAFAAAYGDDWYVVPVRVPIGSIAQIQELSVLDSFGDRHRIASVASGDGKKRTWRFFELNGDDENPGLFVPAVALGRVEGRPTEMVTLIRDETENIAWGIEQRYEGVAERTIDRQSQWQKVRPVEDVAADQSLWKYRLMNPVPPHWIPFIPIRSGDSAQMRLRRGRMSEWTQLSPDQVGIRGTVLLPNPAAPLNLYEEEVPSGGIEVSSAYQFARGVDGRTYVWLGKRKRPAERIRPVHRQTDSIQRA